MSENKHGSIEIEVIHNLGAVEARLDRILGEANEIVRLRDKINELEATIHVLVDNKEEERDHDAT